MTFTRQESDNWRKEVPGARWFKADLHIHTIDDIPGGKAKMPSGITGEPHATSTILAYARRFLQSAVEHGVQVLGITPHSPCVGTVQEASAVWQIVEEWNNGVDDDGVPFRKESTPCSPDSSRRSKTAGVVCIYCYCSTQRSAAIIT